MIVELCMVLLALGSLPFVIFWSVKLGTYAYLCAHELFDREHSISVERKEFEHGKSKGKN